MREIKFRGKHISGQWLYGSYIEERNLSFELGMAKEHIISSIYTKTNDGCIAPYHKVPVMPNTVGQYTGLKDKNGKEIYEGDIVKVNSVANAEMQYDEDSAKFVFYWGINGMPICVELSDERSVEILGNKFDNPELLEK